MNTNKYRVNMVIILVVICFPATLGYRLIIDEQWQQLDELKKQELTLKNVLRIKYEKAVHLKKYQKQLLFLKKYYASLLHEMPLQNKMHHLLDELSLLGKSRGLTLSLFIPQPEITHDSYHELSVKSTMNGSYKQLALFLSDMTAMKKIMTVNELTISKIPSWDEQLSVGDELLMNITITLYRYPTS